MPHLGIGGGGEGCGRETDCYGDAISQCQAVRWLLVTAELFFRLPLLFDLLLGEKLSSRSSRAF